MGSGGNNWDVCRQHNLEVLLLHKGFYLSANYIHLFKVIDMTDGLFSKPPMI